MGYAQTNPSGAASDLLSTLLSAEVPVNGAANATTGKLHVCSGTTADYVINLPAAAGNTGKLVGVRMAASLTKLVTVKANSAELVDGMNTRIMWAGESAILLCDGTGWMKVAGVAIPMLGVLGFAANQTFASGAATVLALSTSLLLKAPAAFQVSASYRMVALRPGQFRVSFMGTTDGSNVTSSEVYISIRKNGATVLGTASWAPASQFNGYTLSSILSLNVGDYLDVVGLYIAGNFVTTFLYNDVAAPGYQRFEVTEVPTW